VVASKGAKNKESHHTHTISLRTLIEFSGGNPSLAFIHVPTHTFNALNVPVHCLASTASPASPPLRLSSCTSLSVCPTPSSLRPPAPLPPLSREGGRERRGGWGGRAAAAEERAAPLLLWVPKGLHPSVHPSIRPSIRPSVRPSVLPRSFVCPSKCPSHGPYPFGPLLSCPLAPPSICPCPSLFHPPVSPSVPSSACPPLCHERSWLRALALLAPSLATSEGAPSLPSSAPVPPSSTRPSYLSLTHSLALIPHPPSPPPPFPSLHHPPPSSLPPSAPPLPPTPTSHHQFSRVHEDMVVPFLDHLHLVKITKNIDAI
jgi:hypothetical protein